jgi:hypothetical protein
MISVSKKDGWFPLKKRKDVYLKTTKMLPLALSLTETRETQWRNKLSVGRYVL